MTASNIILIVDDDPALREVVKLTLELDGFEVLETNNLEGACNILKENHPDLVLMDMSMPGPDGNVVTKELLKIQPGLRVVAYTGHNNPQSVMSMLGAGAKGYLIKGSSFNHLPAMIRECLTGAVVIDPQIQQTLWQAAVEALQYEHHAKSQAQKLAKDLEKSYEEIVLALVEALRTRDNETQGHVDRVVSVSVMLAEELGLDEDAIERTRYGALFHDIGKLGVPDSILFGSGELSEEGWKIIHDHTIVGERILKPIHRLTDVASVVRSTHENWDGSGYPDKLSYERIPIESRLIRVADSFDAMTSGRRYQDQQDLQEALDSIQELSGTNFDPQAVKALMALAKKGMLHTKESIES